MKFLLSRGYFWAGRLPWAARCDKMGTKGKKGGWKMGFRVAALLILACFYGCYFAKMFRQHRRGIQTDQIGKGKTGIVKTIELAMKLATVLAPLAELASIALGTTCLPGWARVLGAALGACGAAVFALSILAMRDSWRAGVAVDDRTELVTGGIYRFSRNPAFLAFDLVYLGILGMFFNWGLFAVSAFAAWTFHLQIVNVEEPFLAAAFGAPYLEYCRQVNRYLGRKG